MTISVLTVRAEEPESNRQPAKSLSTADNHALHEVFKSDSLRCNTLFVHQKAATRASQERYEFLADWVLPNDLHPTFRVTAEFGSTNPPPFAEQPSEMAQRLSPDIVVISPAIDLVDVAKKLGRLNELRERIVSADVLPDDAQQVYAKATLLFLADVAREDFDSATLAFDTVITAAENLDQKSIDFRWPALLMLRAAISSSDKNIRRHVTEFFFSIFLDLKEYSSDFQRDVLNDHLRTMFALNVFMGDDGTIGDRKFNAGKQWVPFGYSDSETRGDGRPSARWHSEDGKVQKVTGHEFDYLSFRSPLRGNFEVEGDFTTAQGRKFSFMVAGHRFHTSSNRDSLVVGNFRKYSQQEPLERALTQFKKTARFRAVVKDGTLTQFVNGEPILKKQLPEEHNPWVAIRSWRRSMGTVSDFRITGEPIIPDEINLTGDPELSGWAPYFEGGFGEGGGNWQGTDDGQGGTAIFGKHRPEYAGSEVQKLLRYCRPIAEDGTIEYDFFYEEGKVGVHPTLDRLAFLLDPKGVKIHWITDRRYERFMRDPANVSEEPDNRLGASGLPLKEGDWNRVKLDVTGDTIQISLNGQAIYRRELEASNQRTFGFFHYADRTEARIRNVVWRGDWPKQLPAIEHQELADTSLDFLDESRSKLAAHYRHDFRDGTLPDQFDISGLATGLEGSDVGTRQFLDVHDGAKQLKSGLRISGDFDITATFQDLELRMDKPRWELRAGLVIHFNSDVTDVCGVYRSLARNENNRRVSFVHSSRPPGKPYTVRGEFEVEESKSGRLRIARRGSTIYALSSSDDSPNFKLVGQREVTDRPVSIQGLRMTLMSSADSFVGVTWKELDVRAEEISGLPPADQQSVIAALNERRESMLKRNIDFADLESLVDNFSITASNPPDMKTEPTGIRITTDSAGRNESTVLVSKVPFGQGSDVEWQFDIKELGHPDIPPTKSEIALKVFFTTSVRNNLGPQEATFILRRTRNGGLVLVTRIVYRNALNRAQFRPLLTVRVDSPDAFRTVVHNGTLYFLYSEAGSDDYKIASTAPIAGDLPARGVELKFVASGDEHTSDVVTMKLIFHESEDSRAAVSN